MSRSFADRALRAGLSSTAFLAGGIVLLILAFVTCSAYPAIREIGLREFLVGSTWRPDGTANARYGAAPMLAGSLAVTVGALLVAGPVGLLLSVFTEFYAPSWLSALMRRFIELLNGIPSVVFGFWGLVTIVPLINQWRPPGQSLLAGVLVLALMIVPTVAITARGALGSVPADHMRTAASLGLGRWATIWNICLPVARRGIIAGMLLGAARAIGETMAVVLVCGNIVQVPKSLFDPVRPVTANIALEMSYATAAHRSALFATCMLLMVMIVGMMVLVEFARGGDANA